MLYSKLFSLPVIGLSLLFSAIAGNVEAVPKRVNSYYPRNHLVPGRYFDRIIIIYLENKNFVDAVKDPYFKKLSKKSRVLTNYAGLTHPSQANYVGMLFGSIDGVNMDFDVDLPGRNLIDLFEEKGISWKAYMEDYPSPCFTNSSSTDGLYRRKHNQFISANTIREDPTRCAKIVNADEFDRDLEDNTLPQYIFYTPNMDNDGHDTDLAYASNWLKGFLEPKFANPNFLGKDTLLVVTFDENDYTLADNLVWTGLFGEAIRRPDGGYGGDTDNTKYNHYNILRTVEDNWSLGTLKREDEKARPIANLRLRSAY